MTKSGSLSTFARLQCLCDAFLRLSADEVNLGERSPREMLSLVLRMTITTTTQTLKKMRMESQRICERDVRSVREDIDMCRTSIVRRKMATKKKRSIIMTMTMTTKMYRTVRMWIAIRTQIKELRERDSINRTLHSDKYLTFHLKFLP